MKTMYGSCSLALRGLLTLMLAVLFSPAPALGEAPTGGQQGAATTSVGALAKTEAVGTPSGGPQEGIKVHGHWVIEVRNPDGTLATRREFNNSITTEGKQALVQLLLRSRSVGRWAIEFDGGQTGSGSPCGTGKTCVINEGPGVVLSASQVLIGTDLSPFGLIGPAPFLEWKGSGKVPADGTISRVFTAISLCNLGSVPPQPCPPPNTGPSFTEATAPADFPETNVVADQIVQITVKFTFS